MLSHFDVHRASLESRGATVGPPTLRVIRLARAVETVGRQARTSLGHKILVSIPYIKSSRDIYIDNEFGMWNEILVHKMYAQKCLNVFQKVHSWILSGNSICSK